MKSLDEIRAANRARVEKKRAEKEKDKAFPRGPNAPRKFKRNTNKWPRSNTPLPY